MIVVFAGNRVDPDGQEPHRFPDRHEDDVRGRLHRVLQSLQPRALVSAAAAGADLIALEEARALGLDVHIVLPLPIDVFREMSVADRGDGWVARFDEALAAARTERRGSLVLHDMRAEDISFREANDWILDKAATVADGDEPIVALTVRPPNGNSVTDDLAERAASRGWPVITVDPRVTGRPAADLLETELDALGS